MSALSDRERAAREAAASAMHERWINVSLDFWLSMADVAVEAYGAALAVSPEPQEERPVYEVERDRFGVMFSGPLEVGAVMRVTPVDPVVRGAEPGGE